MCLFHFLVTIAMVAVDGGICVNQQKTIILEYVNLE